MVFNDNEKNELAHLMVIDNFFRTHYGKENFTLNIEKKDVFLLDDNGNKVRTLLLGGCQYTADNNGITVSSSSDIPSYAHPVRYVEVSEDGSVINTGIFDESIAQPVAKRIDNPSAHSIPLTTMGFQK